MPPQEIIDALSADDDHRVKACLECGPTQKGLSAGVPIMGIYTKAVFPQYQDGGYLNM
jgi:hypothetical protein